MTVLNLAVNSFSGKIPDPISNLKSLSFLDPHGNLLSGTIPGSMSELKELLALDLSLNQLNGSIPRSVMDSMKNMQIIWNLSHNKLAGAIPQEIGGFVMVKEIDLSNNHFQAKYQNLLKDAKICTHWIFRAISFLVSAFSHNVTCLQN